MLELVLAILGLLGGFLIALGWYKRGIMDLEKEVIELRSRMGKLEERSQSTHTDIEVIKQRMGDMERMVGDIHKVIMRPVKIQHE